MTELYMVSVFYCGQLVTHIVEMPMWLPGFYVYLQFPVVVPTIFPQSILKKKNNTIHPHLLMLDLNENMFQIYTFQSSMTPSWLPDSFTCFDVKDVFWLVEKWLLLGTPHQCWISFATEGANTDLKTKWAYVDFTNLFWSWHQTCWQTKENGHHVICEEELRCDFLPECLFLTIDVYGFCITICTRCGLTGHDMWMGVLWCRPVAPQRLWACGAYCFSTLCVDSGRIRTISAFFTTA